MIKKIILVTIIIFPLHLYAFDMSLGIKSSIGFSQEPLLVAGSIGLFSDIGVIRALALAINVDASLYNHTVIAELEILLKGRLTLTDGRLTAAFGLTLGLGYNTLDLASDLGYEIDLGVGFFSLSIRNRYQVVSSNRPPVHRPLGLAVGYGIRFG